MQEDKVLRRHLQLKNLRSLVAESMQLEASMRGVDFLLTGVKDGNVEFEARFYVESDCWCRCMEEEVRFQML